MSLSPTFARMSGPGTPPLYVHNSTGLSPRLTCATRASRLTSTIRGSGLMSGSSGNRNPASQSGGCSEVSAARPAKEIEKNKDRLTINCRRTRVRIAFPSRQLREQVVYQPWNGNVRLEIRRHTWQRVSRLAATLAVLSQIEHRIARAATRCQFIPSNSTPADVHRQSQRGSKPFSALPLQRTGKSKSIEPLRQLACRCHHHHPDQSSANTRMRTEAKA